MAKNLHEASSFDHVPKEMGWAIDKPVFEKTNTKAEFVNLVLARSAVVLKFTEDPEAEVMYTAPSYGSSQGTGLRSGEYYEETKGYLSGFPLITELATKKTFLGIEICGDPNDIHGTNAVLRMV